MELAAVKVPSLRASGAAIVVLIVMAAGGGASDGHFASGSEPVTAASVERSIVLAMDVFAHDNVIDLLRFEDTATRKELRHQRSRDGGTTWTPSSTIDRGDRGIVGHHRGNDPQIAAAGDQIVVLWTMPGPSSWRAGPLAAARSPDGGRTWTAGPNPANDGSDEGHSFLELTADQTGTFQALWLDSRDGNRGLRSASSRDGGRTWPTTRTLDSRTCECCWNKALARSPGSFSVLYRDTDPRDMALSITTDAGRSWTRTATVGEFGWTIDGCPHVGGGLAQTSVDGATSLHALVWTGAPGHEGLHWLASRDGGRTWSAPTRFGTTRAKHADLAAAGSYLAAVWDDMRNGTRVILAATSDDAGVTWQPSAELSTPHRAASHPLVVWSRGRFIAFWTEADGNGHTEWRMKVIPTVNTRSGGT